MIWAIVTKDEMQDCQTSPVFRFYREALGKENIRLAIVDENDQLDFVACDDVVILRTGSKNLTSTIERNGIKSTAEKYDAYVLVKDKALLSECLKHLSLKVPGHHSLSDVEDGKTYFVKPRYGSDSIGITTYCICRSKKDVYEQTIRLRDELLQDAVIEDFIDGVDVTVSCCIIPTRNNDGNSVAVPEIFTASVMVECEETEGIQTRECKVGFKEYCSPLVGKSKEKAENMAKRICMYLGIKHHARMDFRLGYDEELYLIDINLLPGLGPIDHFAKSFLLCHNLSYVDTIKMLVNSADAVSSEKLGRNSVQNVNHKKQPL